MASTHTGITRKSGADGVTYTARASKRLPDGSRDHFWETFRTLKEAQVSRRAWLEEQEGTRGRIQKATLADAVEVWLATFPQTKKPKTGYEYQMTVERYIVPSPLLHLALSKLTTVRIQEWYNDLEVGMRTKELIHQRLCQILDMAVAHERIRENPARRCTVPHAKSRRGVALSQALVTQFLAAAADDVLAPMWHLALATSMRRGELLGLRWSDIDPVGCVVRIRHTVVYAATPISQDSAKSASSERTIQVALSLIEQLKERKYRQDLQRSKAGETWEENGLVFCTRQGRPIGAGNLYPIFNRLLARAGLPETITIHTLRHTALSHLLNNGVPLATVARRGGYRNATVLLAIYTHEDPNQEEAATRVASLLLNPGTTSTESTGTIE